MKKTDTTKRVLEKRRGFNLNLKSYSVGSEAGDDRAGFAGVGGGWCVFL